MVLNNPHSDCVCEICSGKKTLADAEKMAEKAMAKCGWYAHLVGGDDCSPTGFNYHTHGFVESFDHLDIQIVLPMPQDLCHSVANTVVKNIKKKGQKYSPGKLYDNIMKGYNVEFQYATECGRRVLRLLLPDKNGKSKDSETEQYRLQWNKGPGEEDA